MKQIFYKNKNPPSYVLGGFHPPRSTDGSSRNITAGHDASWPAHDPSPIRSN